MQLDTNLRRLTHWMAILAVLLAALAPAISQAIASGTGKSWVEVCTVQGAKWVAVDEAGEGVPAPSQAAFEHCLYCTLHVDGWAPASSGNTADLSSKDRSLPIAFLKASHTLHAWVSAQPRGPPFRLTH